jgi:hypothetical protein
MESKWSLLESVGECQALVISEDDSVWYHDGIQTGSSMALQGDKSYFKSNKWNKYNDNNAVLFVYIYI